MNYYKTLSKEALAAEKSALESAYAAACSRGLNLDMSRGKPSEEQLVMSRGLLDELSSTSDLMIDGQNAGNYGCPEGLRVARQLFGELLSVEKDQVLVSGSSSLNLMFDVLSHGFVRGMQGEEPWSKQAHTQKLRWLCPAPGYDRHFAMSDYFGFENVAIALNDAGPDMDAVEDLVQDPSVKGIWCVPRFSNPTGIVYSDEVVRRFAALKPAASDFRILWDNAYCVHALYDNAPQVANIFEYVGTKDLVYSFASTSKITFAGAGIACIAASKHDLADVMVSTGIERVCSDKISQLAHALYLPDRTCIEAHMKQIAEVLRPKFTLVEEVLSRELGPLDIAQWTHPQGGYFVSFDGERGSAKEIVKLCKDAGLQLTNAGATWPGGTDAADTNIRIAPSYPALEELSRALDLFVLCTKLQAARAALRAL